MTRIVEENPGLERGVYLVGRVVGRRNHPARDGRPAAAELSVDYGHVWAGNGTVWVPEHEAPSVGQEVAIRLDPGRRPRFYTPREG